MEKLKLNKDSENIISNLLEKGYGKNPSEVVKYALVCYQKYVREEESKTEDKAIERILKKIKEGEMEVEDWCNFVKKLKIESVSCKIIKKNKLKVKITSDAMKMISSYNKSLQKRAEEFIWVGVTVTVERYLTEKKIRQYGIHVTYITTFRDGIHCFSGLFGPSITDTKGRTLITKNVGKTYYILGFFKDFSDYKRWLVANGDDFDW